MTFRAAVVNGIMEDQKILTPQVQWAQRKHMIILRVLVKPVEVSS